MQAVAAQTRIQQLEAQRQLEVQRQQEEAESNRKISEALPELVKKVNKRNVQIIGGLALLGGLYWLFNHED